MPPSFSALFASESARYRLSLGLLALSFVNYSFGGLLVRSLDAATSWQIVFWRATALGSFFLVLGLLRHGRAFLTELRGLGRWGLLAGVINGVSPAGYIFALEYTSVANSVFILAVIPFVTAVLARVVLKERIERHTLMAMPVAFAGIAIMVGGGIAGGAWVGNLIALITTLGFSCFVIILRHARTRNMQPCLVVSGAMGVLVAGIASGGDIGASVHDAALCMVWGALLTGVGTTILLFATRYVGGAEATFLMMIEFILAPIWVWLFASEVPRVTTLIGGIIVLVTIAAWGLASARRST
jgi:drug/metabolite transporter (DMT)-like permease